jgi:2-methylisocitrate lyase-like PEP mutase family enzyme
MHWIDRRKRFRALLAGQRCVHPGSVYDAISARIAEDLGFEVGMFAGSVASMAVLGAPDLIVLTLSEFAAQAYRINRAGNLCLLVDADHGYGNALSVKRTVEELETAGVCALSIEDTELPQPFDAAKPRLVGLAEGVGKMPAAPAPSRSPASTMPSPAARPTSRQALMRCSSSAFAREQSSMRSRRPPRCRSSSVAPRPSLPTFPIWRRAACASPYRATSHSRRR